MKHAAFCLAVTVLLLSGCATQSTNSANHGRATVAEEADQVLRVDGESVVLGQATTRPMSREVFVARNAQLIGAGRDEDAGELVRLFPDLAEETVLAASTANPRVVRAIAAWLDVAAQPAQGGWALYVADRQSNPGRYAGYLRSRESIWPALRRGAFVEVARLDLAPPSDGPTAWPEIDALLLHGATTLAAGRPRDAASAFEQAAEAAATWDSRVEIRARLFAALAAKLDGDFESTANARSSVIASLRLDEVQDPMILRLMLETVATPSAAHPGLSTRLVRARLGRIEIQRGSPQAALLAWRAAESDFGSEPSTNALRLDQAEALIALQQDEAAIAMLAGLARTEVRPEALAMLGLVHLRRNQIETGLAMLREAVESTTPQSHPAVHADAGLAFVSAGEADAGRRLLDSARDAYRESGDIDGLRQLLVNQLRYAQSTGDASLVVSTQRALTGLR